MTVKKYGNNDTCEVDTDLHSKLLSINEKADECLALLSKNPDVIAKRPRGSFEHLKSLDKTITADALKALFAEESELKKLAQAICLLKSQKSS